MTGLLFLALAVALPSGAAEVAVSTAVASSAYKTVCQDLRQRGAAEAAAVCARCLALDPAAADCGPKSGRKSKAQAQGKPPALLPSEPGAPPQSEAADACTQAYLGEKDAKALEACKSCLEAEPGNKVCSAALTLAERRLATALMPMKKRRRAVAARGAEQHYLSGVVFFQEDEFAKAKEDWQLCLKLAPGRADCKAGLERLERMGVK